MTLTCNPDSRSSYVPVAAQHALLHFDTSQTKEYSNAPRKKAEFITAARRDGSNRRKEWKRRTSCSEQQNQISGGPDGWAAPH